MHAFRAKRFNVLETAGVAAITAVFVAGVSWAVTVPNTFTAGMPASADEVNANFAELEAAVSALEAKLAALTVVDGTLAGVTGPHWIIEGVNVHVRSGEGSTDEGDCQGAGVDCSGLGNLIVGYNERSSGQVRTGAQRRGLDGRGGLPG